MVPLIRLGTFATGKQAFGAAASPAELTLIEETLEQVEVPVPIAVGPASV